MLNMSKLSDSAACKLRSIISPQACLFFNQFYWLFFTRFLIILQYLTTSKRFEFSLSLIGNLLVIIGLTWSHIYGWRTKMNCHICQREQWRRRRHYMWLTYMNPFTTAKARSWQWLKTISSSIAQWRKLTLSMFLTIFFMCTKHTDAISVPSSQAVNTDGRDCISSAWSMSSLMRWSTMPWQWWLQ